MNKQDNNKTEKRLQESSWQRTFYSLRSPLTHRDMVQFIQSKFFELFITEKMENSSFKKREPIKNN